jgi:hypothetical protein
VSAAISFVFPSEAEGPAVRLPLTQLLGAPFKPGFGLSGIPQHSTRLSVISSEAEGSAVLFPHRRPLLEVIFDSVGICGFFLCLALYVGHDEVE